MCVTALHRSPIVAENQANTYIQDYSLSANQATLCLRHMVVRIMEMRPMAFHGLDLPSFISLFRKDDFTMEQALNIFGVRASMAAYSLIKFGAKNLRKAEREWRGNGMLLSRLTTRQIDDAYSRVRAVFELMSFSKKSFYPAMWVIMNTSGYPADDPRGIPEDT